MIFPHCRFRHQCSSCVGGGWVGIPTHHVQKVAQVKKDVAGLRSMMALVEGNHQLGGGVCKEVPNDGPGAWGEVPCPTWKEPVVGCLWMN